MRKLIHKLRAWFSGRAPDFVDTVAEPPAVDLEIHDMPPERLAA